MEAIPPLLADREDMDLPEVPVGEVEDPEAVLRAAPQFPTFTEEGAADERLAIPRLRLRFMRQRHLDRIADRGVMLAFDRVHVFPDLRRVDDPEGAATRHDHNYSLYEPVA